MKISLSGSSSFMLASHLHLMKYLPPQDYTTPPKLFSWPNMAIIPNVTNWNGSQGEGVFVSRDKRKDAAPAHIEGDGRIKSCGNRTYLEPTIYPLNPGVSFVTRNHLDLSYSVLCVSLNKDIMTL